MVDRASEGIERNHPLYERLKNADSLLCKPEGSVVKRIIIDGPMSGTDRIKLTVTFRFDRERVLYLLPNGELLKGGTISEEDEAVVRPMLDTLEQILGENADPLPEIIHLPHPAFIPERHGPLEPSEDGATHGPRNRSLDEQRLRMLQEGLARFQFGPQAGSLVGYVCVVYPRGLFFENAQKENAAFALDAPNLLSELNIDTTKDALSPDEQREIQEHILTHILPPGTTKNAFVKQGAERIRHIGEWQERVREALARLIGET